MRKWDMVKLREVLFQRRIGVALEPEETYKQVTVKINHKGVTLRGLVNGIDVASKQYLVKQGQFIVSRIDARNRAFGIVPEELEGAIVTNDYLLFDTDEILDVDFLNYFAGTEYFDSKCKQASEGSTNRVRLKMDKFFRIEIPLPPLSKQRRIVAKLKGVEKKIAEVKRLREEQGSVVSNLLFSKYKDAIEGAAWKAMGEVAPIVKRQVEIEPLTVYRETGIRSFGRGTFEKPSFEGGSLTWQKPRWLKKDDIVFSNIKAWEGAVALISAEENGTVGSHRYISCVPDKEQVLPEFLLYYFQTEEGVEKLSDASPGSADRNRTLNLTKLKKFEVPVPSIEKQRAFIALKTKLEQFAAKRGEQAVALEGVLPGLLDRAFRGEV